MGAIDSTLERADIAFQKKDFATAYELYLECFNISVCSEYYDKLDICNRLGCLGKDMLFALEKLVKKNDEFLQDKYYVRLYEIYRKTGDTNVVVKFLNEISDIHDTCKLSSTTFIALLFNRYYEEALRVSKDLLMLGQITENNYYDNVIRIASQQEEVKAISTIETCIEHQEESNHPLNYYRLCDYVNLTNRLDNLQRCISFFEKNLTRKQSVTMRMALLYSMVLAKTQEKSVKLYSDLRKEILSASGNEIEGQSITFLMEELLKLKHLASEQNCNNITEKSLISSSNYVNNNANEEMIQTIKDNDSIPSLVDKYLHLVQANECKKKLKSTKKSSKIRVNDLAKELNIRNKMLIAFLLNNEIPVKSHMSFLTEEQACLVRETFQNKTDEVESSQISEKSVEIKDSKQKKHTAIFAKKTTTRQKGTVDNIEPIINIEDTLPIIKEDSNEMVGKCNVATECTSPIVTNENGTSLGWSSRLKRNSLRNKASKPIYKLFHLYPNCIDEINLQKSIYGAAILIIKNRINSTFGQENYRVSNYDVFREIFPVYGGMNFSNAEIDEVILLLRQLDRLFLTVNHQAFSLRFKATNMLSVILELKTEVNGIKYMMFDSATKELSLVGLAVFISTFLTVDEKREFWFRALRSNREETEAFERDLFGQIPSYTSSEEIFDVNTYQYYLIQVFIILGIQKISIEPNDVSEDRSKYDFEERFTDCFGYSPHLLKNIHALCNKSYFSCSTNSYKEGDDSFELQDLQNTLFNCICESNEEHAQSLKDLCSMSNNIIRRLTSPSNEPKTNTAETIDLNALPEQSFDTEKISDVIDKIIIDATDNDYWILKELTYRQPVSMVLETFDDFTTKLGKISDSEIFMKLIIALSWNKRYLYKPGVKYGEDEFRAFAKYYSPLKDILNYQYSSGMSASNVLAVYMNSFFKLAVPLSDLDIIGDKEINTILSKYPVVISRDTEKLVSIASPLNLVLKIHDDNLSILMDYLMGNLTYRDNVFSFEMDSNLSFKARYNYWRKDIVTLYDRISTGDLLTKIELEKLSSIPKEVFENDEDLVSVAYTSISKRILSHNSYQKTRDIIEWMGHVNPMSCDSFAPVHGPAVSRYSQTEALFERYRNVFKSCTRFSEAIYLYSNTGIKQNKSLQEYVFLCRDMGLISDEYSQFITVLVHMRSISSGINISFVDVRMDGVAKISNECLEHIESGKYYLRLLLKGTDEGTCNVYLEDVYAAVDGNPQKYITDIHMLLTSYDSVQE